MEPRVLKLHLFEYIIGELAKRYRDNDLQDFNADNDFSKLKVMKLLFFVIAIDAKSNDLIDNYFTRFYAMPYGPVELDIYESIQNNDRLTRFRIDRNSSECLFANWNDFDNSFVDARDEHLREFTSIDRAIHTLLEFNKNIIHLRAYDLVEISHMWNSWRISYDIARSNARYQHPIYNEIIREENQIFSLA